MSNTKRIHIHTSLTNRAIITRDLVLRTSDIIPENIIAPDIKLREIEPGNITTEVLEKI